MSNTIGEAYESRAEWEALLADAEASVTTEKEMDFVCDVQERYKKYGSRMYISEKQRVWLEKIAKVGASGQEYW